MLGVAYNQQGQEEQLVGVRLEALANSSNATAGNPADGVSSSAPPTIAPAKGTRDDLQSAEFDWDDEQVARKRHSRGPSPGDPRDPAPVPPFWTAHQTNANPAHEHPAPEHPPPELPASMPPLWMAHQT